MASVGLEDDHFIAVWDWKRGQLLSQTRGHKSKIFDIKWSPTSEQLVSVGMKHIKFWKPAGAGLIGKGGIFGAVTKITSMLCVSFSRDGTAYTGGANGMIHKWTGNQLSSRVKAHEGPVFAIYAVEKGFITGGKDGSVALWDATFTTCVKQYPIKKSVLVPGSPPMFDDQPTVRAVTLAKGRIYAGTSGGEIVQIDKDGPCQVIIQGHAQGEVWGLACHPTQPVFATSSDDMRLRIWDMQAHRLLALKKFKKESRSVAYSPDGQLLAVGMKVENALVLASFYFLPSSFLVFSLLECDCSLRQAGLRVYRMAVSSS